MAAAALQRVRTILLPSTRSNASLARLIVDRRCTRAPARATHGLSIRALSFARSNFSKTPSAAETPPSLVGVLVAHFSLLYLARIERSFASVTRWKLIIIHGLNDGGWLMKAYNTRYI